jgi:hypothetical protein
MRLRGLLVFVVGCSAIEPERAIDAGPIPAATEVPAELTKSCTPCISAGAVEWRAAAGPEGASRSAMLGCRTYQHVLDPTDALRLPCEHPLPACDARVGITVAQLEHALAHPELSRALARAPVVFGKAPRLSDGRRFRLTIDGKTIDVGDDCDEPQGNAGCAPIPSGVRAVVLLLAAIDAQEAPACR